MTGIWSLIGPAIGALATIVGVLTGSRIGNRSQERNWARGACRDACGDVLASYAKIHDEFSFWARHSKVPEIDWPSWNRAMNMLRLVGTPKLVQAGDAVDAEFWFIEAELEAGKLGVDNWLRMQAGLEAKHLAFINTARRHLLPGSIDLATSIGRPGPESPIWGKPEQHTTSKPGDE
ncbi:hypothetical protein [Catellatospora chokoriensis]|uniref:Uncharacterized protein n=1 Tax=Catellatospora chokoriensis TaxID=310353 RepID=A0A8J3KCU0_9ACTN|nr:hypothetical protein [Catellatospora chokoriensis]GIF93619.1 hypothetical protein Cch02nite_70630 [Catellatospora chokoriensis]